MSEEEIKKIAKEEFMNNVMEQLDSTLIFTYIQKLENQLQQKENIIKEVREYITSYESISIMRGIMNEYSNYDLDIKTMNEMIRRYMVVHDELLKILDKENK